MCLSIKQKKKGWIQTRFYFSQGDIVKSILVVSVQKLIIYNCIISALLSKHIKNTLLYIFILIYSMR